MTKRLFAWICVVLAFAILLSAMPGCGSKEDQNLSVTTGVVKDEEFLNVYIDLTIDEFNALGFAFGDSVDIAFDNGKSYEDIPYYSGYSVPVGQMLLCGYPGYPHPVIARNYGESTWAEFEMTADSKVTVTLREKGKYAATQELYSLSYYDERERYDSDVMFANFREVKGGNLASGKFYRSASPCDNQHNRASYANALAEEYGIGFALNLSDNETKYADHVAQSDFTSVYYDTLFQNGKVLLLSMNANYRSDGFAAILSGAFLAMAEEDGPTLIHCVEGKDRTGFACALLLALADATEQEIIDDYMITYANYYRITKESDARKYEAILVNVNDFIACLRNTDTETVSLKLGAELYLQRGGLTADQIAQIEAAITTE